MVLVMVPIAKRSWKLLVGKSDASVLHVAVSGLVCKRLDVQAGKHV